MTEDDILFATELFEGVGEITTRKMMGGLCLYADGVIFAIIHPDGGLMLKCQGPMIERIEAMGSTRWTYQRDGSDKVVAMPYWSFPDTALDDPETAGALAREALEHLR